MGIEDDIAVLQRVPTFGRLGAGALRILAIGIESSNLQPGEVLFTAGDVSDGGFIVETGSFSLKSERAGEAEVVAGAGTLLGEAALLAETRRPATATARERSKVLRISRSMFLRMLEGYPDAAQRLRELIASRSDQSARELENVRAALTRHKDRP